MRYVLELKNNKDLITCINKLRDVYSCVKIDKINQILARDQEDATSRLSSVLYSGKLGSQVALDESNNTLVFEDPEISNSVIDKAQNAANGHLVQKEMHSLVQLIESQNLRLVELLGQVGDTTTQLKLSNQSLKSKEKKNKRSG
jgi:hypothetical protein